MAQPPPYEITTHFGLEKYDTEFNNLKETIDSILANLALIQRDDGKIKDGTGESHIFNLDPETSGFLKYNSGSWNFLPDPLDPARTAQAAAVIAQAAAEAAQTLAESHRDNAQTSKLAAETAQAAAEVANQSIPSALNVQAGTYWHAASTGSGSAYLLTLAPIPTALIAGLFIHMKAHTQNTGAATLNVNGLGAKPIKKTSGIELESGEIPADALITLVYDGTNFQLINSTLSVDDLKIMKSHMFSMFETIQENHAGSLLMEKAWSDSFSNANEQGADEANSSSFQHDATGKLYKGNGLGLISDKTYDTESNFVQQEWDKTNNGFGGTTSQATVASGTTVTITADSSPNGKFPPNCANGRISFDGGSNWYDISSRNSDTQLTLETTAANGTFDYSIQMSKFFSKQALLNSTGGFPIGDGRDGSVTITSSNNINTDVLGSLRSTNADGIATAVTVNPTGTSITVNSITGFANGDKVLLINMQGTTGDTTDVGNFEILTVSGSPSGSVINVEETISKSYDGASFANQRVICQRIPQWNDVNINSGADLTCNAWDGTTGGVLIFYSFGTVTVSSGRTINADSKGYRGGIKSETSGIIADQGESRTGPGSANTSANDGGGGGAESNNGDGGGGGYATAGLAGNVSAPKPGSGGGTYGSTTLTNLFMGSGGGGGAYTSGASDGAPGGGIIYINAKIISITGNITSKGGISATTTAGAWTEGGGGAGGSILIRTEELTIGTNSVDVNGGHADWGVDKSTGGVGRIRLEYKTINTNPHPNSSAENTGCDPDPGSTAATTSPSYVSSNYVSLCDLEVQKTDTTNWIDINSASITETLDSQNLFYWIGFDPVASFGDGTEVKIFNATGSVWRVIAKNESGTWKYNNASSNDATYTPTNSTTNSMLHAVSEAISTQAANRMTGAELTAITDTQWEELDGWSVSINAIIRGVTLYSNASSQTPSVAKYGLNFDIPRNAMDLKSKTYDPGFTPSEAYLWARAEHSDADGVGTFSVSRNGGTEWTTVSMVQQGLPISGDVRILSGLADISGQTSGQDFRCRYQTTQGKDQFLHSWGLLAKL
jgi:hypothetical protein